MLSNSHEDLAYITSIGTVEYPAARVDLSRFLIQRIKFFSTISKINHKKIESEIEPDLCVTINPVELERLIDNNISNGIKYAQKGQPITIRSSKGDNQITLSFHTYGSPIEKCKRVFERNYRENEAKRGLGLGLNMDKGICEKYRISYSVSYADGQNVFTYRFSF